MVDIDKQKIKLIQKDQDQDQIFQGNQIQIENKKYQNKVQNQNQNQDNSQIDLTSIQKKNSQNLPLLKEDQNSETIQKNKKFFENQEQSQNVSQWQQNIYSRKQSRDLGGKNIEQDIFAGFSLALQKAKNMALQEKIKRIWLAHYRDTEGYRKKNLGQKQLRLIFDLGSASIKQVDLNLFKQSFEKIMKQFGCFTRKVMGLLKYIKLLHPNHKIITMLQIIESIFIIQLFFTYTWYIFFDFTNTGFQLCQDLVGLVIFTFSAVVRMNTSYYDQGDLVEDRLKIFARYKKSLVYDACAFWALIYNMSTIQEATYIQRIMVLPIFAKTQTLVDSVEGLIQKISIQGKVFYMYELVKLLAQAVILCHVFGTLFWILGQFEHHILDDKLNWINNKGIIDAHWYEQYMESFYWAQATIMLVGTKGDTFIETCYACTVLFITVGYFAIILSAIANLLQDFQDREKELKENKQIITSFINEQSVKTDIPQDLQGKMINFLVFHFSGHQDQKDNLKFENLLAKYPQDLKEKINQIRFGQNLQKIGILNDNFQNLQSCINDVELEFYMPDQIIQYRGSFADKIYLVLKGSVKLLQENLGERSVVHTYKEGEYFGQEQFFTDKASMYDIKSSDFSTLLSISRSQFIENILQEQGQNDFEKFKMISHQFQIGGKSDFVIKQCKICSQLYHNEEECKFVFYNPNQELTILKDIYSVPIRERRQIKRRKKKFLNHTLNLENIQNLQESIFNLIFSRKMRKYIKNLSDMLQDYEDRNKDAYYEAQRFLQEQQEEMEEKKLLENENYSQMSYIEQQDCSYEYNQRIETLQSQKIQSDNSLIKEGKQENQNQKQKQIIKIQRNLELESGQKFGSDQNLVSFEDEKVQNINDRRVKTQQSNEIIGQDLKLQQYFSTQNKGNFQNPNEKYKYPNFEKNINQNQNKNFIDKFQHQQKSVDDDSNNKLGQENSILHDDSIELQLNDAEPSIQDIQQIKNNDNFQALGMNIKNNQQNQLLSQSQQQILSEIPKIHLQQQQFQEEFRSILKYYQKNINQQIQSQNSAIQRTIIEVDRQQYKNIQNLLKEFISNEKGNKGMDFSGGSQVNYQNNFGQKKNNSSRFAFQRVSQQNEINSQNNYQYNYNNNILKNKDFNQNRSINFQQNLGKNQEMNRSGNQKRVTQLQSSQDMVFSNQNRQKGNLIIERFQSQNQEKKKNQNRNQSQIKNKNGETLTYGIDLNQLPAQELFKIFQSQPNMSQSRFINLLNQLQNNQFLEEEQHDGDNIFCSCKDCKEKDEFFWEFESLNKFETFFPQNNWNYVKIKFFKHEHEKELYIKQLRKASISAQNKSNEPNYKLFSKNKKNLRGIGDFKIGFGAQIMKKYQNQPKFKNKKVKGNKNILMKTKAKE